ncbi:MAG: efflux RND transporter periplasmic adaptor subunit [Victivallaceae bacterium]|nr:efflux RND transporter periplasmic adaptor subunit [Victivallaceae bacterium]
MIKKSILFLAVALIVVTAMAYWGYCKYSSKAAGTYSFSGAPVVRGNLQSTIVATGTVEPEELVNVGTQVGGMIASFGKDSHGKSVDYGSPVKAGMVLARIDDALYVAAAKQANAQKLQAEAAILSAKASIDQAKAKYACAKSNLDRAKKLYPKGALSGSDYDSALAEFESTRAAIAVSEAALEEAKASLELAKANCDSANRNVGYCTISSPVDGVIIDRRVSVGQTVVSSMSAPSLFLIARDLKKMQVWVSVNEADIGGIRVGMQAIFTVDAFPDRKFKAIVHKIRLNATLSQNVVTYVVEVSTDNSDGKLLPYLTALVRFVTAAREDVLLVPNGALRFSPSPAMFSAQFRDWKAQGDKRYVFVRGDSGLIPVEVETGLNDGTSTEIKKGLTENMYVVTSARVGANSSGSASASGGSPFVPKPPARH